jgi:hypothetical protein
LHQQGLLLLSAISADSLSPATAAIGTARIRLIIVVAFRTFQFSPRPALLLASVQLNFGLLELFNLRQLQHSFTRSLLLSPLFTPRGFR